MQEPQVEPEAEEAQEEEEESDREEASKKEEDDDEDEEEEEEGERGGRFKTERKDEEISKIRTVSSTAENRKAIPDKLGILN